MDALANIPWHRSPWGSEILATCQKIVAGEIGCVEGSRNMVAYSANVLDAAHGEKWLHKDWKIFFKVVWAAEELQTKGEALCEIEKIYSEQVRDAVSKLLKDAKESGSDGSLS